MVQVEKVSKSHLTTVMNFLAYLKDKGFADKAQEELDENIRKSRR